MNAAMPAAQNGMQPGGQAVMMQPGGAMQPGMQMQQPAAMQGSYPMPPNMVPGAGAPAYPGYPMAQPPMAAYPGYPVPPQAGAPGFPPYGAPTGAAPPSATASPPAAGTAAPAAAQPAPNMFDPAAVERAARAIGTGVIEALPKAGLPINPALINEGSKMLQTVLSGNALTPAKPGVTAPSAHAAAGGSTSTTQTVTTFQSSDSSSAAEAPPAALMTLSDLLKGAMYNLEMTQEALYLSTFGDPNMRLTSALEAQRNANEARVAADKAAALVPNASGQAAEMITATRNAALRAQTFADQARDAANSGSVVSPQ